MVKKFGEDPYREYTQVGLNNVGSYQVAGYPWITGSQIDDAHEHRHQFPSVARSVTVILSGNVDTHNNPLRVHFTSTGSIDWGPISGNHFVGLDGDDDAVTFNCKCKEIYVSADDGDSAYQVFAELTGIGPARMFELTGSGLTD